MIFPVAAKWKAYVDNRAFDRFNYDIYLYRECDDGRIRTVVVKDVDERGDLIFEEKTVDPEFLQPGDTPPTFRLPRNMASALITALSNYGIKPPDDGKLVGLYEAQGKHLADLQAIVTALLGNPKSAVNGVSGE